LRPETVDYIRYTEMFPDSEPAEEAAELALLNGSDKVVQFAA
jgi:hypothetical protein